LTSALLNPVRFQNLNFVLIDLDASSVDDALNEKRYTRKRLTTFRTLYVSNISVAVKYFGPTEADDGSLNKRATYWTWFGPADEDKQVEKRFTRKTYEYSTAFVLFNHSLAVKWFGPTEADAPLDKRYYPWNWFGPADEDKQIDKRYTSKTRVIHNLCSVQLFPRCEMVRSHRRAFRA
jgi:hypothetical protein